MNYQHPPMPAQGYPQAPTMGQVSSGVAQHILVETTYQPPRLKTNEEWAADASAAADRAAAALLKQATMERLQTLHSHIVQTLQAEQPVAAELLDEYTTLAS